jgi:hypothetical protein
MEINEGKRMIPLKVNNLFQITLPEHHEPFTELGLEPKNRHVKRIVESRVFQARPLAAQEVPEYRRWAKF